MSTITESNSFDATVYEYDSTDPVQGHVSGGSIGVANTPIQNLANRTRWLYNVLEALIAGTGTLPSWIAPLNSPVFTGSPTAPNVAAGDNSTKIANTDFVQTAANGLATIACAGSNIVLTQAQWGVSILKLTGAMSANINIVFPTQSGQWIVENATTGAYTVNCTTASGTGILATQGLNSYVFCDGTNINLATSNPPGPALPIFITAAGAFSQTVPAGYTRAKVWLTAGGGNAGSGINVNYAGGGGGGGETVLKLLTGLVPDTSILAGSIGAGGVIISETVQGGNGGNTTLQLNGTGTVWTAHGGAGGMPGTASTGAGGIGGVGGSGGNGDQNYPGAPGSPGLNGLFGGTGGGGWMGAGGGSSNQNQGGVQAGQGGSAPGAGGGAWVNPSGGSLGGSGAAGQVIFEFLP